MSDQQDSETDSGPPPDMFPVVWVKMEVDEDGVVDGIDESEGQESDDQDYQHSETPEEEDVSKPNTQRRPSKRRRPQARTYHLKCEYCEYRTSFKNALKFHTLKHTNPEPLSCDLCDYTTRYPCSLRRHMMGQHKLKENETDELPTFNCTECDYTTMFKGNLAAHKRKHAKEKRFKCDQCNFSSAYRNSYIKHSKMHKVKNSTTLYQCDQCTFSTRYEGHIARHLAQIHKIISTKAHKCDQCHFSTTIRWRLSIHKNRSRQPAPIKCQFCDFVTQYNCNFKLHKVKHPGKKNRIVETDIYMPNKDYIPTSEEISEKIDELLKRKNAEDMSGLNLLPSNVDKNNEALVPAMIGKTEYLLDTESDGIDWRTIKVLENSGGEKPFQCTGCDYTSKFKASVQRHFQRLHTEENSKPYKCMHCDFSTKTKDQISLHNKRSKSDVPLTCKLCDYTTNLKCQIVQHQKVHYPYKCKLCTYTCRIHSDIQRHYSTIHLGNGLKCQYCDYRAARKDSLMCHETLHTGVKPFQCQFCEYATVRRSVLDQHIRKLHPENYKVTVIDYSKIQSLKVDTCELQNREDIVEENPLFQGGVKRSEIESKSQENLKTNLDQSEFEGESEKRYEMETTVEVIHGPLMNPGSTQSSPQCNPK